MLLEMPEMEPRNPRSHHQERAKGPATIAIIAKSNAMQVLWDSLARIVSVENARIAAFISSAKELRNAPLPRPLRRAQMLRSRRRLSHLHH